MTPSTRLDLTPKRIANATGYSRFVGVMRYALPAAAVALLGLVFAWPQIFGAAQGIISPSEMVRSVALGEPMRMNSPRYVGKMGDNGAPVTVTADSGIIDPDKPDEVSLVGMRADMPDQNGRDVVVTAGTGLYHRNAGSLALDNGVVLTTRDGFRFTSASSAVDMKGGTVSGDQAVRGDGPAGTLDADSYRIEENGKVMKFNGRVRVRVLPSSKDAPKS